MRGDRVRSAPPVQYAAMSKVTIETTADSTSALSRCDLAIRAPEAAGRGAWLVRAPVCIDVMGGITEHTGATVLGTPSALSVMVAVKGRTDQTLGLWMVPSESRAQRQPATREWPLSVFYADIGRLQSPDELLEHIGPLSAPESAALSAVHAMLASGQLPHLGGGINIAVESPRRPLVESVASIQAATAAAVAKQFGQEVDRARIAACCRLGHNAFERRPVGPAMHLQCLAAQPGALLQVCSASHKLAGALDVPEGATIIGIDCGMRHQRADEKHTHAWVAALMGRDIIRIIAQRMNGRMGGLSHDWDGMLARLSVTDYVDHIRDHLPTKVKGSAFIERFGQLKERGARIDPSATYKVRSRAEHHIYDNERVRQFAERMARANRTHDPKAVAESGELMYASHWSYGQRCGLGSIATDQLVYLLRKHGHKRGVLGARICGPGAGGCVAALVESTPTARQAVDTAIDAYQSQSGRKVYTFQTGRTQTRPFAIYHND